MCHEAGNPACQKDWQNCLDRNASEISSQHSGDEDSTREQHNPANRLTKPYIRRAIKDLYSRKAYGLERTDPWRHDVQFLQRLQPMDPYDLASEAALGSP